SCSTTKTRQRSCSTSCSTRTPSSPAARSSHSTLPVPTSLSTPAFNPAFNPEPALLHPEPAVVHAEPALLHPEPALLHPEPAVVLAEPAVLHAEPGSKPERRRTRPAGSVDRVSSLRPVSGATESVVNLLADWLAAPAEPEPLVVETSGSTGRPKRVVLSRRAMVASAEATHAHLAGP